MSSSKPCDRVEKRPVYCEDYQYLDALSRLSQELSDKIRDHANQFDLLYETEIDVKATIRYSSMDLSQGNIFSFIGMPSSSAT